MKQIKPTKFLLLIALLTLASCNSNTENSKDTSIDSVPSMDEVSSEDDNISSQEEDPSSGEIIVSSSEDILPSSEDENSSEEMSQSSEESSSEENSQSSEDQTSSETDITSSEEHTDSSEETQSSSEEHTDSSEETQSSSESSSESSEGEFNYNPHKGEKMPNGYSYVNMPDNIKNPLDLTEKKEFDCSNELPENWAYLYGNNIATPKFFTANHENIALQFGDANRGIQTPAFKASNHIEIRLHLSQFHGQSKTRPNNAPETFTIYGFDENQNIVYNDNYTPTKGLDFKSKNYKYDLDFDIKGHPEVRYAQIRFNEPMWDSSDRHQYVSVGATSLRLASYPR